MKWILKNQGSILCGLNSETFQNTLKYLVDGFFNNWVDQKTGNIIFETKEKPRDLPSLNIEWIEFNS